MRQSIVVGFVLMSYGWFLPVLAADSIECNSAGETSKALIQEISETPLPKRGGAQIQTSGGVPHVQVEVVSVAAINEELFRLVFTLPNLEERATVVSLPGGVGLWLTDDVRIVHPKAIVSGREFAHIHIDGSLHAPLPLKRALELEKKGWGERHPWADRYDGWEGLVMLYSASTKEELKTLVQLISESYNYVTGRSIRTPNC